MKLGKLSVLSAAALLAGGMSIAVAQSNMAPRRIGRGGASRKASAGTPPATPSRTSPGPPAAPRRRARVTTGSSPSGQTNNAKGTGNTQTRPANAANLPNC